MKKAGRKPLDTIKRESRISIKLTEQELKDIEEMAEYLEIPKSSFARNCLLFGLEESNGFKRTGLLKVAKGLKKTSEFLNQLNTLKTQ